MCLSSNWFRNGLTTCNPRQRNSLILVGSDHEARWTLTARTCLSVKNGDGRPSSSSRTSTRLHSLRFYSTTPPCIVGKGAIATVKKARLRTAKKSTKWLWFPAQVEAEHDGPKDQIRCRLTQTPNELNAARIIPGLIVRVVRERCRETTWRIGASTNLPATAPPR